MQYRKALPLLVVLSAAPILSPTASAGTSGPFATTDSGFYIGAGAGRFDLHITDLEDVGTAASTVAHNNNNAWKGFLGYRFAPFIAIEADYIDFGHASDRFTTTGSNGSYRVKLSGWAPYVIGTIPLGPVELFGKAGYLIYNVDLRAHFDDALLTDVTSSHSRSNFTYGGGLGLTLFGHLNASAEYDVIKISHADNSNAFWLNLAWRF
jgi:hypothetical protein